MVKMLLVRAGLISLLTVTLAHPLAAQPVPAISPTFDPADNIADPVDIPTGIYLRSYIDIAIYDTVSIELKRQYRNRDSISRAFGIGTSHVYDWYLWTNRPDGSFVDLILEDGNRVRYLQQNPGTGYQQWVFVNRSSPTNFLNSEMRWDSGKWKVTLLDGTVYKFLPCGNHTRQKCKLVEYHNPRGGWLRMTRDADGNLLSIINHRNRGIVFRNDSAGRIIEAKAMGSKRVVKYEYDDLGRLKHVANTGLMMYGDRTVDLLMRFMEFIGRLPKRIPESIDYEYDASHNMTRMKDSTGFEMVNKYDAAGRVIHQELGDGRTWSFENQVDKKGNILQTDITNPDRTIDRMTFDLDHNTLTEIHRLGLPHEIKWSYKREPATKQIIAIGVECALKDGTKVRYNGTVGPGQSTDGLKRQFRSRCKTVRETN